MKIFPCVMLVVVAVGGYGRHATALDIVKECLTETECDERYGRELCCITHMADTYSCPNGWYILSGTTCQRAAINTIDSIGYLKTTYGTCEATSGGQKECYGQWQKYVGGPVINICINKFN